MPKNRIIKALFYIVVFFLLLGGMLSLFAGFAHHADLKTHLDRLAPDGNLESFTPELHRNLTPFLLSIGFLATSVGVLSLIFRKYSQSLLTNSIAWLKSYLRTLCEDFAELGRTIGAYFGDRKYLLLLIILIFAAIINRALFLSQPMEHDEAYTFIVFASKPLRQAISDYHLPNNHVFHTVLVHISTRLLGEAPWAIRLPAYLAGILMVPASFLLGSMFFNAHVGLLASSFVVFSPLLVDYSVNARGYTILSLVSLSIFILAFVIYSNKNTAAWLLVVILSSLGFYTIPTMLYPFGMMLTWLFLSEMTRKSSRSKIVAIIINLSIACLFVLAITAVLYTPIFRKSGINSVIGNNIVSPLGWDLFIESLFGRFINAWNAWNADIPAVISGLLFIGFLISIIIHSKISRFRVQMPIALLVWLVIALPIQRVAPPWRIWLFLLPIYFIYASAGLISVLGKLTDLPWLKKFKYGVLTLICLAFALFSLTQMSRKYVDEIHNQIGSVEQVALYLRDNLIKDTNVVVVTSPHDAQLWYYFRVYGVPDDFVSRIKHTDFESAYLIINEKYGQSVEQVAHMRGNFEEVLNLESYQLVESFGHIDLFLVMHK